LASSRLPRTASALRAGVVQKTLTNILQDRAVALNPRHHGTEALIANGKAHE
jgi:hypothetical protein